MMIIRLFRAEFAKITRNYPVTCCLIWIWPFLAIALSLLLLMLVLLSSETKQSLQEDPALWTESMLAAWVIPNNQIARLVLLGFVAVLFGGEYQWNTWKTIVPRSQRVPLIVVKFISLGVFVLFAFTLTSIFLGVGFGVVSGVADAPYGPPLTAELVRDFAEDYLIQMFLAFITVMIAGGYAALAAMVTRSILGSIIVGVGATFIEALSVLGILLFVTFTGFEESLHLYRFTPTYNLLNVARWLEEGLATDYEINGQQVADTLEFSLVVLSVWVAGLIGGTAFWFQRQDVVN